MSLNIPNLDRLISHLEGLPEEKFDMRELFDGPEFHGMFKVPHPEGCGTVACIAGHCAWVAGVAVGCAWDGNLAANWIGIDWDSECALFTPPGFLDTPSRFPLSRAIRTLKHMRSEYLRTGQVVVDWDAPEPVTKAAWSAPRAVEQAKPALPAEIVRFLNSADLEVSA